MIRIADVRPCPNCASRVVPVCVCNACGSVAVRADVAEVDRKIVCAECRAENATLFVCETCNNRFLFEEVAGPHKEQFACLLCGTFVDADAKACPACGAVFEEDATRVPIVKKERPKRKVRGEYTDSDVDEIARIPGVGRAKAEALCRAGYNALWRIKRASVEELGRIRIIGVRGAKMVKDSLRFILLLPQRKSKEQILSEEYVCPLCGCVTSLFAKTCSDCGAVFDEEEIEDDVRREVQKELDKGLLAFYDVHLEEAPDDSDLWYARALLLLDIKELPEAMKSIDMASRMDTSSRRAMTVRSRILAAMREMKQASQVLRGTLAAIAGETEVRPEAVPEKGKAQEEAQAASDAFQALTSLAEPECPMCGEHVLPDSTVCPACGHRLEPEPTPKSAAEELDVEPEAVARPEARFVAMKELEKIIEQAPSIQPPKKKRPERVLEELPETEELPEEEEVPAEEEPSVVEPEAEITPEVPPARRSIETPGPRARVSPAPPARFRRGLIDGHGLINGTGRVNGLVNGLGFMDTSTITDFGLQPRSLLFRYAVIGSALLLVFAIVAALLPGPVGPMTAITIDGNPSDWSSIPKYVDPAVASNPNVTIERYGVYQEGDLLSFMIQVSGTALGDPVGNDAFYAFFDTDGSLATGYQVQGLGAEYVAEVVGGSGRVQSARLFEFPANSELNWSRRASVAGLDAVASGSTLEFRVSISDFASFSPSASTILLAADDFEGSTSRASVALSATFGAIRVRQVPLVSSLPSGTTVALRLDVEVVGGVGIADTWVVGPFTFAATPGVTVTPSVSQVTLTRAAPNASVMISVTFAGFPSGTPIAVALQSAPAPRPVTVVGSGLDAYFLSAPVGIRIDGLFADWTTLAVADTDPVPVASPSVDIRTYAGAANASGTFFMFQVAGPLLEGIPAPQKIPRATSGGGGGGQGAPPPRLTGEDIARVYIDTNGTDAVGFPYNGMYADYMIEVRGSNGRITRQDEYRWQSGWVPSVLPLQLAKNATAIEGSLGLNPATLNGTRMAFQASDWSGMGDVTDVLLTRSTDAGATRGSPPPVVMDISGNGKFYFHNTNHATETACTFNKVADANHGAGPVANISLSGSQTACWYVDATSGTTIPAGDWESLLDIFSGGVGAAYTVRLEIWNKTSNSVSETIQACGSAEPFGDDVQCVKTGVPQKVLTSAQVVRVNVGHSGGGPVVYIEYDGADTSGDSRATLPLPEFHEIAIPIATVLLMVLALRRRLRGRRWG